MVDASTSHYLVPGIALAHGGTQTEPSSRWEKGVAALAEAKERGTAAQQLVVQARDALPRRRQGRQQPPLPTGPQRHTCKLRVPMRKRSLRR